MNKHNLTFEATLKKYDRYLKSIVNNFRMEKEFDDMLQIAKIAMYEAYCSYNPTKSNLPFEKYFPIQIRYALFDYLTENSRLIRLPANVVIKERKGEYEQAKVVSIDTPTNDDENVPLIERIASVEYDYTKKDYLFLKTAVNSLKPKHKDIVLKYVGLNENFEEVETMTFVDIAKIYNCNHQNIQQQFHIAVKKLKKTIPNKKTT